MKKIVIGLFAITFALGSCTTSSRSSNNNTTTPAQVIQTVQSGAWKISYFFDSGKNETNNYNNYLFTFQSNGTLTASNGSNTVNGTWSSGNDDSQTKLDISLGNTNPWDDISDDWHVIAQSSTQIQLQDVSGGSGDIDYLTFTKN
jgi:hypothetical protein